MDALRKHVVVKMKPADLVVCCWYYVLHTSCKLHIDCAHTNLSTASNLYCCTWMANRTAVSQEARPLMHAHGVSFACVVRPSSYTENSTSRSHGICIVSYSSSSSSTNLNCFSSKLIRTPSVKKRTMCNRVRPRGARANDLPLPMIFPILTFPLSSSLLPPSLHL